ncbi:MAG: hypothetical protein HYW23_04010 [Candidatus Aenigmarchaeota archaeon]|nr:hypothetical protein [Candidatus Aenigmarchaeota archaeon]
MPSDLTPLLAEDVGIQVGDGSMPLWRNKHGTLIHRIGVFGNIKEDKEYFRNIVIPTKNKLFNLKLNLYYHKSAGTCYIKFESKAVMTFYFTSIGLQWGKKVETYIPDIIFNSTKEIKSAFMRGLADTDFCLSFKKNFKGKYSDPYIQLGCSSNILVRQCSKILKSLGITSTKILDSKEYDKRTDKFYIKNYLFIHGKKNLKKWMESIGFHNPVHFTKYDIWKKFGFCPPRTKLQQRIDTLEGNADISNLCNNSSTF